MTTQRDLERALDNFFVGVDEVADRVIDDALLTIEHTRQRRARRVPWRFPDMNSSLKLATIAAAVVLAFGGTAWMLGRGPGAGPGGIPLATPSPSAAPSLSPAPAPSSSPSSISTAGWRAFSSNRYGFDIRYPDKWNATQSAREWTFAVDQKDWLTPAADVFIGPVGPRFTAFAVDLPAGTTPDEWIASYHGPDGTGTPDPCGKTPVDLRTNEVDGQSVVFWNEDDTPDCGGTGGYVVIGTRIHVFTIWLSGQEQIFEALLSTVRFRP